MTYKLVVAKRDVMDMELQTTVMIPRYFELLVTLLLQKIARTDPFDFFVTSSLICSFTIIVDSFNRAIYFSPSKSATNIKSPESLKIFASVTYSSAESQFLS